MTQYENPFAFPLATSADDLSLQMASKDGLIVDGGRLRAAIGAEFPDRCVKCNAPANGYRLSRKLAWHRPVLYVLFFVALLLYILAALVMTKRAKIQIGLCEQHRQKRRRIQIISYSIAALSFLGVVASFAIASFELGLLSLIVAVVAALVGAVGSRVISPSEITHEYTVIKGCGAEFLHSIG